MTSYQARNLITADGALDLVQLAALAGRRPALFEPAEPQFWTDPYIAQQMLKTHLDPDIDAASRHPAIIDATVAWIIERLGLAAGDALLDLGCGPGLYCKRFAARGLDVTGVDFSENSLRYAREHAHGTETYVLLNYLDLDYTNRFDVVTLIYGDFCPLSDAQRATLLGHIHRALKPGGHFVFDVTTPVQNRRTVIPPVWSVHKDGGFWKPGPHLMLAQVFDYPADDAILEQYIVVEADGKTTVYHNWFKAFTEETITPLLEAHGFRVAGLYNDLTGAPCTPDSPWLGIVAQKT
ncbi:MAG: class I SAM-dependent methyltransferase [Anaerolineae bacterium]|nr:class I SAM-dependent methyltransferase [Anaerolineae bacterium]